MKRKGLTVTILAVVVATLLGTVLGRAERARKVREQLASASMTEAAAAVAQKNSSRREAINDRKNAALPPLLNLQDAAPALSLAPASLDFGDQVVGSVSKAKRITVTNPGGKPLYVDSVTSGGDNSSDFSVVNDTCTGATVPPNRACIIDVTFTPSDTDERNARLKLTDNALDSPQRVSLTGNGINSVDVPPPGLMRR